VTDTVVIIAAGEMGAGIGRRLAERGARVLTSLRDRGAGSAARARAAGMIDVTDDDDLVAQADVVLSVVPPGQAAALAERLKGPLSRTAGAPLYVDCNAVAPDTARTIGGILAGTRAQFVDGGIIGGPPAQGYSPNLYVSGPQARDVLRLSGYGLSVRPIEGGIGAASALKMSYAGITKGITAIGIAMLLGASRAGCADELRQELSESQPQILQRMARQVPASFPKAYRWVAEMEEIAAFLGDDPAGRILFQGIARLYERIASGEDGAVPGAAAELEALRAFLAPPAEPRSKAG